MEEHVRAPLLSLYEHLLTYTEDLPNIRTVQHAVYEPAVGVFRGSEGTASLYFKSLGFIDIRFETEWRHHLRLSTNPIRRVKFISLDDLARHIEEDTQKRRVSHELGAPIAADRDFLFYERKVEGTSNPEQHELVVISRSANSFYERRLRQQHGTIRYSGRLEKSEPFARPRTERTIMEFSGHPIIDRYVEGLLARYGPPPYGPPPQPAPLAPR